MNADDMDGGTGTGAETDEASLSDEQRVELVREQLKRLRVADVASDIMVTLVTLGYQKLGLTSETRDLRNLDDAHLAIEVLRSLVETVGREVGEARVASFRSTLDAMQMSYARVIMQEGERGGEAPPATPSAEAPRAEPAAEGEPAAKRPATRRKSQAKPGAKAAPRGKTKAAKAAKSKPAAGRRKADRAAGDETSS